MFVSYAPHQGQVEASCKQLRMHAQVQIPEKLEQQLRAGMQDAGIPVPETEERWNQAMTALKV